jgi:hypothetical protein
MCTIRLLLPVANLHEYEIYQADVKIAFSNGSITEEIYVQ